MKGALVNNINEEQRNAFKYFIRFLKDNGIYRRFFNILRGNPEGFYTEKYKSNMVIFFNNALPDNWLNDSIVWDRQKEGREFWCIKNNKWIREYLEWLKNNEIQRK